MPDSKNLNWANDFGTEAESDAEKPEGPLPPDEPAANDSDGLQQYRHWISKAPAPRGRRVGIDPSLYTWKGYRNWTEQVKRAWHDEQDGDK